MLTSNNFRKLKEAVVELFEKSKPEVFDQLISKVQLTGRPSLYVKELRDLASKVGVGDDLVRHILLQSLPRTVGAVLAAQRELTLHQLGKLADELMPLLQTSCLAAPAQPLPQPFQQQQHHQQFQQQHQPFQQQQHHQHERDHHQQARGSNQPQGAAHQHSACCGSSLPPGLRPFHRDQRPQVCRAHLYFGVEAKTCKPWCRWPEKKNRLAIQPSSRRTSPERNPCQGNE